MQTRMFKARACLRPTLILVALFASIVCVFFTIEVEASEGYAQSTKLERTTRILRRCRARAQRGRPCASQRISTLKKRRKKLRRRLRRRRQTTPAQSPAINAIEPAPSPEPTAIPPRPTPRPVAQPTSTPIPIVTPSDESIANKPKGTFPAGAVLRWESQMMIHGSAHCLGLSSGWFDSETALSHTYYDAALVFSQIAEYTGQDSWYGCVEAAHKYYRDNYVVSNNGNIPGYWNFSRGLLMDFYRTSSGKSYSAVQLLAGNAAFANPSTPLSSLNDPELSRETAYALLAHHDLRMMGDRRYHDRADRLAEVSRSHLRQWFRSGQTVRTKSFMVGLTLRSLIYYYEDGYQDEALVEEIMNALEQLWKTNWVPSAQAFRYQNVSFQSGQWENGLGDGTAPAPDLNLLLAPAYEWAYQRSGVQWFRERGDEIFEGGVTQAFVEGAKQFNQQYLWSFDYVKWRRRN